MKVKKQLKLLKGFLDGNLRKKRKQRAELRALLKRMKHKEKHLKEKLADESDSSHASRLRHEIEILHAQRKKGVTALKNAESA